MNTDTQQYHIYSNVRRGFYWNLALKYVR